MPYACCEGAFCLNRQSCIWLPWCQPSRILPELFAAVSHLCAGVSQSCETVFGTVMTGLYFQHLLLKQCIISLCQACLLVPSPPPPSTCLRAKRSLQAQTDRRATWQRFFFKFWTFLSRLIESRARAYAGPCFRRVSCVGHSVISRC